MAKDILVFREYHAGMAELADAQDSESCGVTPVEVQLLFPAYIFAKQKYMRFQ